MLVKEFNIWWLSGCVYFLQLLAMLCIHDACRFTNRFKISQKHVMYNKRNFLGISQTMALAIHALIASSSLLSINIMSQFSRA